MHVFFDGFDGLHTGETQVLQSVNHTGHQFVRYGGTRGDTYGFQTLEPCRVKLAGIIHAIRFAALPQALLRHLHKSHGIRGVGRSDNHHAIGLLGHQFDRSLTIRRGIADIRTRRLLNPREFGLQRGNGFGGRVAIFAAIVQPREILAGRSPAVIQQQRTALGRALIKDASLLLLDEPLVNLDYKLREELRRELTELFSSGSTTVVYATTEPLEALQLGGHVAVLHEGRLLQQGPTLDVFNAPHSIDVARTFSDPPINLIPARVDGHGVAQAADGLAIHLSGAQRARLGERRDVILGVRAHSLHLSPQSDGDVPIAATVDLAEISGSETYVHARRGELALVAQLGGVHNLEIGSACTVYCQPHALLIFADDGGLLFAPVQGGV